MADEAPLWLFGDQLGRGFHASAANSGREIVLIESAHALAHRRYHRQKLHLVLSGMRHLADELGDRCTVVRAPTYAEGLRRFGRPVAVHEPGSHAAESLVHRLAGDGTVREILPTASFALSRAEFADWAGERTRFRMEDFYRDQRRRFEVLLEHDGEPVGGRWNYDTENRNGPPRGQAQLDVPAAYHPRETEIDAQVRADLDGMAERGEIDPVGVDGPRLFPVTHDEAHRALRRFVRERLPHFGPHQDAMLDDDWEMAHALLSVPLNLGLLDPLGVVRAAEREYQDGNAPLASVEGFLRQVLGWREYVWHLYWHFGRDYLRRNALRAQRKLPDWWAELDTSGLTARCLSDALGGVHDRGWAHHIQRLMVLGNHALQRGYQPGELTDWFATAFVDGFPWVMPVNVIGMSQHADGGVVATKPYAAGGAYLNRMSDYCGDCAFDPKQRRGEHACPFTAGYWHFLHANADRLADNHRMKQPLRNLQRLSDVDEVVAAERDRRQF